MICIPCQDKYIFVQLIGEIFEILDLWKTIYADLQGVYINTVNTLTLKQAQIPTICEGFVDNKVNTEEPNIVAISTQDLCMHRILSRKLNYTIAKPDSLETIPHGLATNIIFISEEMQIHGKTERWRWLPHAVRFNRFYFISIVKKPDFNAAVLIQPFTWVTWTTIFICGAVMGLVTKAIDIYTLCIEKNHNQHTFNNLKEICTW